MPKRADQIFIEALTNGLVREDADVLWRPTPGPQARALDCVADELFYGGAAGGGKTDLLLGLALTRHVKSIIYRREFPQFRDLIDRGNEILGPTGVEFKWNKSRWEGLQNGGVVELGAVPLDKDLAKFKGRPHDMVGFDELPDFTEWQYRFLTGWNRTTRKGQRVRVVAAGNPPTTSEGEWVIRYWAPWLDTNHPNPAEPGELRWFAVLSGQDIEVDGPEPFDHKGEMILPTSRTFIPARLEDNPYLMETNYRAKLMGMPEPLRSQLLYGDFTVGSDIDSWQAIPTDWVRAAQARWNPNIVLSGRPDSMGIDVARGGDDQTCVARCWNTTLDAEAWPGRKTYDGPSVAMLAIDRLPEGEDGWNVPIAVDLIGPGTSVVDTLRASGYKRLTAFNAAAKSRARARKSKLRFVNQRAQMYWRFREALDPETGVNMVLPPSVELMADLCAARYKITTRGIQIEEKDNIKKRIGRSPDTGEAIMLAWYARTNIASLEAWSPEEW